MMGLLSYFYSPRRSTGHDVSHETTIAMQNSNSTLRLRVPMEIVIQILDAAYHDGDLKSNTSLLVNSSLVSRDWSIVSQKLLFSHVTLRTQDAFVAFRDAVDCTTPRGCMLRDAVQHMRVVLDHNQPDALSQHSFGFAVTLCPNLKELDVALHGRAAPSHDDVGSSDGSRVRRALPSFDDYTLQLLSCGPSISTLRFSNWSDDRYALFQLLDLWPALTSLDARGLAPQLPCPSPEPFPCALREFRANFQTPPAVEFTKWLLHNSAASLRVLALERTPAPHVLDRLVAEHGATLQTLSLPACPARDAAAALRRCPGLRELRVEHAWAAPAVYKALPDTLEHLAFGVDAETPLQPALHAIRRGAALRTVTVHVWRGGAAHALLPSVTIACALQGVALRVTHDVRDFRAAPAPAV